MPADSYFEQGEAGPLWGTAMGALERCDLAPYVTQPYVTDLHGTLSLFLCIVSPHLWRNAADVLLLAVLSELLKLIHL